MSRIYEKFISSYLDLANNYSFNNELMNMGGMLVILGQCLKEKLYNIRGAVYDGRIHCLCIQKSGTGKGPALDFVRKISELIGLKTDIITSLTTAGLIGTLSGNDIIYGPAYYSDVILVQEANMLFIEGVASADLLYYLNQIIDPRGIVNKRLARGSIEYVSRSSLFLTTHPPNRELSSKITSGFLPRMLMSYKEIDRKDYELIMDWIADNVGEGEPEENLEYVIDVLLNLRKNAKNIAFEYTGNFREISSTIKEIMDDYSIATQDCAEVYMARMLIQGIKIANALAAIDNTNEVRNEHIEKASEILGLFWTSTLSYMESFEVDKRERKIIKFKKQLERLFEKFGSPLSSTTIMRYTKLKIDELNVLVEQLCDMQYVKKRPKGRSFEIEKI